MPRQADSWSTQQLVEFLAAVSAYTDASSAIVGAVEKAAAALEAEVAAVVIAGQVRSSIGFARGDTPDRRLAELAEQAGGTLEVPGVGPCRAASVPVEAQEPGWLLIARHGDDPLADEEHDLLRGMGRVLAMSLKTVRLVDTLQERQALLERLSRLQRSIASRVNLQQVLDSIVAGAAELIGDEVVELRLLRDDDPTRADLVSSIGLDERDVQDAARTRVGEGATGRAIAEGHLVVVEHAPGVRAAPVLSGGLTAAMAAPIYERGRVAGSLGVASRWDVRTYSDSEREVLTAFAEHASIALNDANAVAETVRQAFHDSLTGLPNRALFLDRLEHATARSQRSGTNVAVLFGDLDGFKTVNDSLGHAAGDELLVMVAERLRRGLRPADTAARFGGDEFAILLEDLRGDGAPRLVAQRIVESFEDPFKVRGREVYVTISLGIADGQGEADHMLRNADLAMYQAKSRGKGRYEVFEPGMHAAVVNRLELEVDLKQALEREELVLHYQPVCRLATGEISGVEALVRWQHPEKGLLEPDDFIPLAEESRQILSLGRWVLEEACRQGAAWQARHPTVAPLEIGVNFSGVQLEQPELVDEVSAALQRTGLDPRCLVLEITETALMADTQANVGKLEALKAIGVQLAVDDFGTGYSSLEYLRRFPIDVLKMAKSFVDGLRSPAESEALVRTIIDLAGNLGMRVVAEGVEEETQLERLIEMGCGHGQGFLFAQPAPAAATDLVLLRPTLTGRPG